MAEMFALIWQAFSIEKKYSNFAYSITTATETLTTLNFQVQHNRFELKKTNLLLTESWRIVLGILTLY